MKIALFSEDRYNKTLHILTRRILGERTTVITRWKKRHDLLKEEKVYSHIVHDILQDHPDTSKIIVCVDSECTSEEEVLKELKKVECSMQAKVKLSVHYVCVTHAVEGWLLGDPHGVEQYLGPRAKVRVPLSATLECKPKDVMKEIFQKAAREFLPFRDNERIAERIDIPTVAKNNKGFDRFREQIKDP